MSKEVLAAQISANGTGTVDSSQFETPYTDAIRRYVDIDFYTTVNITNNAGAQFGYRSFDLGYTIESDLGDFKLQDHLGAKHSLTEWKDKRAIVVVFLGTECPLAKLYATRLAKG